CRYTISGVSVISFLRRIYRKSQKFEHACQYKMPAEKKLSAVTRKKIGKPKEADKTANMSAKKATSGDKAKSVAPETPVKAPLRSLPIRKPSGTLPKPIADASKG
ncbi:MAG: hypothetical protein COZ23_02440, partial [Hydrogenophilales bacterium CG_4_10_14_3_um_filter_58_23]